MPDKKILPVQIIKADMEAFAHGVDEKNDILLEQLDELLNNEEHYLNAKNEDIKTNVTSINRDISSTKLEFEKTKEKVRDDILGIIESTKREWHNIDEGINEELSRFLGIPRLFITDDLRRLVLYKFDKEVTLLGIACQKIYGFYLPELQLTVDKAEIRNLSSRTAEVRTELNALSKNVRTLIPLVEETFAKISMLGLYTNIINKFYTSLAFYGINNRELFEHLSKLKDEQIIQISEKNILEIISEKIAVKLTESGRPITKQVVLLLSQKIFGYEIPELFQNIKNDEQSMRSLCKILLDSGKLYRPVNRPMYNEDEISFILDKNDEFDIQTLNIQLSDYLRKLDYVDSYLDFLNKNGVKVTSEFKIKELAEIPQIDGPYDEQVLFIVKEVGKKIFLDNGTESDWVDAVVNASISLKFQNDASFRASACKLSGNEGSAIVIKTLYDVNKGNPERTVTLGNLVSDEKLLDLMKKEVPDPELNYLMDRLSNGIWYDGLSNLLKDLLEKQSSELKDKISELENFTILKEALRQTFQRAEIGTVEKAIDAQLFCAYLLIIDSKLGNFAPIVDQLSIRNLSAQKRENRWERRAIHSVDEGVMDEPAPKYDFVKFSDSVRIGLLDKGEQFHEFKTAFLTDVKKLLEKEKTALQIGLVIQRITPSMHSFGHLDVKDLPGNIELQDLDISYYITRLASDYTSLEEQAAVIKMQRGLNILDFVNEKTFYELIRTENDDLNAEERRLFESGEFNKELKITLRDSSGLGELGFKPFAIEYGSNRIDASILKDTVSAFLTRTMYPGVTPNRQRISLIYGRFLKVISNLATVWTAV